MQATLYQNYNMLYKIYAAKLSKYNVNVVGYFSYSLPFQICRKEKKTCIMFVKGFYTITCFALDAYQLTVLNSYGYVLNIFFMRMRYVYVVRQGMSGCLLFYMFNYFFVQVHFSLHCINNCSDNQIERDTTVYGPIPIKKVVEGEMKILEEDPKESLKPKLISLQDIYKGIYSI